GLHRGQAVGVDRAQGVPEGFAPSPAVHGRPRGDRPAVVELPDDASGAVGPLGAEVLDAQGDRPGLVDLGQVVPVVEVGGLAEVRGQAAGEFAVAVGGLLVVQHAGRVRAQLLVGQRRAQGGVGGRRLEPELGDEAGPVVAVGGVVHLVPHVPDVHGGVPGVVGVHVRRARVGAARPVGAGGVDL